MNASMIDKYLNNSNNVQGIRTTEMPGEGTAVSTMKFYLPLILRTVTWTSCEILSPDFSNYKQLALGLMASNQ